MGGLGLGGAEADQAQGLAGGRDRMRHAWGSLRERLGLRASGSSGTPTDAGSGGGDANTRTGDAATGARTRPDGTPMDAREVMLAEMARAFNLGLGLGGDAALGGATGGNASEVGSAGQGAGVDAGMGERDLPPEDSFERFLVDLQADLRIALTQNPPMSGEETRRGLRRASSSLHRARTRSMDENASPAAAEGLDGLVTRTQDEGASDAMNHADAGRVIADDDIPPLEDVSDSDAESEFADGEGADERGTTTDSELPPPIPVSPSDVHTPHPFSHHPDPSAPITSANANSPSSSGSASGTERRPGGGINWWRLYRFPAITAPLAQGLSPMPANAAGTAATPRASTTSPVSSDAADSAFTSASPDLPSSTQSSPPGAAEGRPNIVIPVIVVGLQSVNMGRRRDARGVPSDAEDVFAAEDGDPEASLEDEMEFDGFPSVAEEDARAREGRPGTPRGRRWHARAADAIRSFRPGRRGTERGPQPGEGPGSRTFLIYVIGGEL